MKKILISIFGLLGVVAALFLSVVALRTIDDANSGSKGGDKVLNIYNWGDYIDPDLLTKFTKETGYRVNYETFDSNESMYTKVKQGGTSYDIVVPSEYMIEKMKAENLLLPIDHKQVPNLKNFDDRFLNQSFDKNNKYSVPYFWGTLGIVYNDKLVDGSKIKHWDDLWRKEFKNNILILDSSRDNLGLSLVSLGKSVNTTNLSDLQLAKAKLDTLMPNIKAILNDEIPMYMNNEEAGIAVTFSGVAADIISDNPNLHYVLPEEGGNLWFDDLAIPKTAKHIKAAHEFINFMSDPKNAAQNAEYIGYATPNKEALKLLPADVRNNKQFYPDTQTVSNLEVYRDLGQYWTQKYNDLFLEFKMTNR